MVGFSITSGGALHTLKGDIVLLTPCQMSAKSKNYSDINSVSKTGNQLLHVLGKLLPGLLEITC